MKKIHMFVDNSNVKIEGARLAYAKRHRGGVRGNEVDNGGLKSEVQHRWLIFNEW